MQLAAAGGLAAYDAQRAERRRLQERNAGGAGGGVQCIMHHPRTRARTGEEVAFVVHGRMTFSFLFVVHGRMTVNTWAGPQPKAQGDPG